jgi:transposase
MSREYYIGLDVHKDSVSMAVLNDAGNEVIAQKVLDGDYAKILKAILPYKGMGDVFVAYEAGCLGYALQRYLEKEGINCRIIPPNKVFRPGSDKIKTDKRDAVLIAQMLKRGEGGSINILTRDDEAARDLGRCRGDLKDELKRAKQQLMNFVLRHGFKYENTNYWTLKHRKWIKGLVFDHPLDKITLEFYINQIENVEERIKRIEDEIKKVAESPRYAEAVKKLRAFKGIDYITALALICEIGDFTRFGSADKFMAYLGLVPSEYSSGKKRKQGGITKTGNSHLRKLLTEASQHYAKTSRVGKRLAARRVGMSETVITYADKAISRLHSKFTKIVYRGKPRNVAITAVSRELAGFIWGVMNMAA